MTMQTSQNSDAIARIAEGFGERIAELASVPEPPEPKRLAWAEELERGGFTRAGAPEDFERLCHLAEDMESGRLRNAIFLGGVGRGKTLAATIIARRVFRAIGYEPQFKPQFLRASQFSAKSIDQYEDADLVAMFRNATLCDVVLDDFGSEETGKVYGVETDLCTEFLKNYFDKNDPRKHLIVTTNIQDLGAMRERVGDRLFDRMMESVGWLKFKSRNKRAEKAIVY